MYLEHIVSHTNIFQPHFTHKEKSYKDIQHYMFYIGEIIIWKFPQMTGLTSEYREEVKTKSSSDTK